LFERFLGELLAAASSGAFRSDFNAKGALGCTTYADPDVTEHNKTPVRAFAAPTGVISSEYGQAVPPLRGGKLHCLGEKLFEERTPHNRKFDHRRIFLLRLEIPFSDEQDFDGYLDAE
jgi:hypothetical protein